MVSPFVHLKSHIVHLTSCYIQNIYSLFCARQTISKHQITPSITAHTIGARYELIS